MYVPKRIKRSGNICSFFLCPWFVANGRIVKYTTRHLFKCTIRTEKGKNEIKQKVIINPSKLVIYCWVIISAHKGTPGKRDRCKRYRKAVNLLYSCDIYRTTRTRFIFTIFISFFIISFS